MDETKPERCSHSGQTLDERCDKCDPPRAEPERCPDCQWEGCRVDRHGELYERFACHERTIARLRTEALLARGKIASLEAETMTLTSERDTARMGQDECAQMAESLAGIRDAWERWQSGESALAEFEQTLAERVEDRLRVP